MLEDALVRASSRCFALLAAALLGCSAETEPGQQADRVGRAIQPVIAGVPSSAEHDAVVVLARFEAGIRKNLCTATLVAPNLVLTARHCVSTTDSSVGCATDGTAIVGAAIHDDYVAPNLVVFAGKDGQVASIVDESVASARGAKLIVDEATSLCNHDLAFVLLDRPVDAPIATLRLSGGPTWSERVTIVGWGITEAGTLPAQRMEREGVPVTGTGPTLMPNDKRYGIGNAEVLFGESACLGDSGGPAFTRGGALVGVASRVGNGTPRDPANLASTCTGDEVSATYTHLGQSADLVKRAFAEAGNLPVVEPESIAVTTPKLGDPQESDVGRQTQDPDPRTAPPQASILQAKADLDTSAPAAEDGGCSVSHRRSTARHAWLFGLVVLFAACKTRRRATDRVGRGSSPRV